MSVDKDTKFHSEVCPKCGITVCVPLSPDGRPLYRAGHECKPEQKSELSQTVKY